MADSERPDDDAIDRTSLESFSIEEAEAMDEPEAAEAGRKSAGPRRLGDFELLREIGRGGMGVVYEATQMSLARRVALKVLPPALGMSHQATKRFEREAQAAAKLHHTHIVPVHAIGEQDGHHFYAMDLIEGESLDRILHELTEKGTSQLMEDSVMRVVSEVRPKDPAARSPDPVSTSHSDSAAGGREWFVAVARMIADVAEALHYAHGRGVIHRDIKPANLMLSRDGVLSITDFGLARVLDEPGMTVSGSFLGTPAYMAPEQIAAGRIGVDQRADLYSLGAVLYEMLTLARPFSGDSREKILSAVLMKDPRPLRKFNHRIPVDLETICLKALEKDPDRRYATAAAMALDLRQYLQGGLIAARRAGVVRRTWKWIRRHPVAATAVVAALLVGTASGVAWKAAKRGAVARAEQVVSKALLDLRAGLYREGLETVQQALDRNPDLSTARVVRARLLMKLGRTSEAMEDARAVLAENPDDWTAHLILARMGAEDIGSNLMAGVRAEEHVAAVERLAPENADAYYLRALVADSLEHELELLDRALDLNPGHAEALLVRITLYRDHYKDFRSALQDCERLIVARPRSAQGRRMKAVVYRDQRDYVRALSAIDEAIEFDPRDPNNYLVRGQLRSYTGHTEESIEDMDRAIELDPGYALSYQYRAPRLARLGRFEEAIRDARRALELNPDFRWSYSLLFRMYRDLRRHDDLRATMEELRRRAENWSDRKERSIAFQELSLYERLLGRDAQALADAERAIELDPTGVTGFVRRAEVKRRADGESAVHAQCELAAAIDLSTPAALLKRGDTMRDFCRRPGRALADYTRAIELAPHWADPYSERAASLLSEDRPEEGLADLDKAIELQPQWGEVYFDRGDLNASLERFEAAFNDYEHCLGLGQKGLPLYANRGYTLLRLGRDSEALSAADAAIAIRPLDAGGYVVRARFLFWLGRVYETATMLQKAIEVSPTSFRPHHDLAGYAIYTSEACDLVQESLDRAEELAGESASAWAGLAWLHAAGLHGKCPQQYDQAHALEFSELALRLDPQDGEVLRARAFVLYRVGRYEEALESIERSVEAGYEIERFEDLYLPEEPATLFVATMAAWQLDMKERARSYLGRAVRRTEATFPRSPELAALRAEASRLLGVAP